MDMCDKQQKEAKESFLKDLATLLVKHKAFIEIVDEFPNDWDSPQIMEVSLMTKYHNNEIVSDFQTFSIGARICTKQY